MLRKSKPVFSRFLAAAICCLFFGSFALQPAIAGVSEPKSIKKSSKLKSDEGAVRLSIRIQRQYIDTLFVYFVKLNEDGTDSDSNFRFERGAGVPLLGSNMIDPKEEVYRMKPGRYRLRGFTIKCEQIPPPGSTCTINYTIKLPTGAYSAPSPVFTVVSGQLTDAGDFIVEREDLPAEKGVNVFSATTETARWQALWLPSNTPPHPNFSDLPVTENGLEIPSNFKSRISCKSRPAGIQLYIPFAC